MFTNAWVVERPFNSFERSKLMVVKLLSYQIQNPRTNDRLKHFAEC